MRDFDWENKLSLVGIINKVALLNETVATIMSNFIPNETMIFDDRDTPWLKDTIKAFFAIVIRCSRLRL